MIASSTMAILPSFISYPRGRLPPTQIPFRFDAAILSRMRSEVTSRSNWAKDRSTLSVSRPIEVVVLNCWVTETNDTRWASKSSTSLAKSAKRPRQAIDLIDNDDVDLPGADVLQQSLQIGTVGRPTGVSPIVIAGPDQGPAGMGLAFDIGGGSIVLRIQRVELLVEPVLGGDPCIDRAADRSDGRSLHDRASIVDRSSLSRRPKKRGPFHLVPVMAKATLERLS